MDARLALVVEDDPGLAELFAEALRKLGFEVEAVSSGEAAQARLAASVPAMVLMDLKLPRIAGELLLQQVRADPRLAGTRTVVITGEARRAEVLRSQADLVLVKPVGYGQLKELLARLGLPAAE